VVFIEGGFYRNFEEEGELVYKEEVKDIEK